MKKAVIFIALILSLGLFKLGVSARSSVENLNDEISMYKKKIFNMQEQIRYKKTLIKRPGISLSREYGLLMNQVRLLENYSGTSMNVQLEDAKNTDDITGHYENTSYKGVWGLKVRIVIDKFSNETDMGAVLDDVHLLEKNTDFMACAITKDNNNLIVKGEIYGL